MHENNIIHRDFKLENVFIKDGIYKIGDLGFAKEADFTRTILGTSYYMAPEIHFGLTYSNKADIWSLAVVIYSLLFGTFPYNVDTEEKLKKEIIKGFI